MALRQHDLKNTMLEKISLDESQEVRILNNESE